MQKKKKGQRKGEKKETTRNSEGFDSTEDSTELNKSDERYRKRPTESNWAKYEIPDVESEATNDGNESHETSDFNFLLKNACSDFAQFEFSSEKMWREKNLLLPSKIFNLDLNLLSAGLACVPFHEMLDLDESDLTADEKVFFEREAEKNWETYKPIQENYLKQLFRSGNLGLKTGAKERIIENNTEILFLNPGSYEKGKISTEIESIEVGGGKSVEVLDCETDKNCDKKLNNSETLPLPQTIEKAIFDDGENLEDWLNGVLDD